MAKQTIGRRYGIAVAKQYFGRQTRNPELEAQGKRAQAKADKEIDERIAEGTLTEEEYEEAGLYESALDVYEGIRMIYSALTMQASTHILTGAIALKGICKAEEEHYAILHRPLLVFEDPEGGVCDAAGKPIDASAEDLESFDTESDEGYNGLLFALVHNTNAYRYTQVGTAVCDEIKLKPTVDNPDPKAAAQVCDRGAMWHMEGHCADLSFFPELLEVNEAAQRLIGQAAELVRDAISGMYRYRFAAKVIEAFLKIDGAADGLTPPDKGEAIAGMIESHWNPAAEELRSGRFVKRWNGTEERSREYEEAIVTRICDTDIKLLNTAAVTEEPPEGEVKAAARAMTYRDLRSIRTFEAFLNRVCKAGA